MMWRVFLTQNAEKQFRRLPIEAAHRIGRASDLMQNDPLGGDVVKLEGRGYTWRRRVGSYRILFELMLDKRIVFIYDITRRTSKTYSRG